MCRVSSLAESGGFEAFEAACELLNPHFDPEKQPLTAGGDFTLTFEFLRDGTRAFP